MDLVRQYRYQSLAPLQCFQLSVDLCNKKLFPLFSESSTENQLFLQWSSETSRFISDHDFKRYEVIPCSSYNSNRLSKSCGISANFVSLLESTEATNCPRWFRCLILSVFCLDFPYKIFKITPWDPSVLPWLPLYNFEDNPMGSKRFARTWL